jgi:chromosome segregation ATPase
MHSATRWRLTVALILCGCVDLAVHAQQSTPAQQADDDVAAAARKAKAQKQSAPKPKKIVTNDDLPSVSQSSAVPSSKTEGAASAAPTDQAADKLAVPGDDKNSEAYWRKRFAKANDKLAQAEKELDLLQRELSKDQVQYYNDPQKALMQQNSRQDINDKTAKIDAKKKEIESLKQQLSDMEEELRKTGGDPGWAR